MEAREAASAHEPNTKRHGARATYRSGDVTRLQVRLRGPPCARASPVGIFTVLLVQRTGQVTSPDCKCGADVRDIGSNRAFCEKCNHAEMFWEGMRLHFTK
ncbi:hypothetical protein NDU88_011149 [Pleurodeles waltl]|uniref:Uncharacterized protein n=1 Tax=Pleurodeles waltl TaxID=8319 RepID=A0AAV7S0Y4_PLEWA|nr:hypothetical protein NDU88_011149 [Pleurodeles waltl]